MQLCNAASRVCTALANESDHQSVNRPERRIRGSVLRDYARDTLTCIGTRTRTGGEHVARPCSDDLTSAGTHKVVRKSTSILSRITIFHIYSLDGKKIHEEMERESIQAADRHHYKHAIFPIKLIRKREKRCNCGTRPQHSSAPVFPRLLYH
jgi:hypothetical protein